MLRCAHDDLSMKLTELLATKGLACALGGGRGANIAVEQQGCLALLHIHCNRIAFSCSSLTVLPVVWVP